jgi:hypothetical protein
MRTITLLAVVLPLALAVGACTQRHAASPVAPGPPEEGIAIRDGAWVTDPDAVSLAAAAAARHPLAQAAITAYGAKRLRAVPESTIRAIGSTTSGLDVEFTTLPFVSDGDPTHGVFVTVGSVGGTVVAQQSELIVGREPRGDEPGFAALAIPGGVVWLKEAEAVSQPSGVSGAPQKWNKLRFMSCLVANAPAACDAGAAIGSQIAPNVPVARSIGCAVGVVGAALACFAGASGTPKA